MERYYFDLYNAEHGQVDDQGQLFANRERARLEALRILQDIARDEAPGTEQLKITVKLRTEKAQIFEASLTLDSTWN
ncbi:MULTISPECIES: hypothetical protein [unclassified Mesorhizobium]|uniref:DUF6894 family protein n=1 Tax=unclassified Mesorhizobium TaxID=325217 RepID=UPI001128EE18|nr:MULTISPECIES: hypothetical protein [unclassified Mesorhizobium]TPI18112.1 hypothetical protein FJW10_20125 [Mesorhizobium sp. B4-1-1]TPL40207.1 hypothetical protein FJ957_27280 [Mesorhizobium sp. B2-4-6]